MQSIRRMARAAFCPQSALSEEVEAALIELADEWVASTLTLGCGAARKRKSVTLMPEDVAKAVESIWCA
jgi:histone H3/H4